MEKASTWREAAATGPRQTAMYQGAGPGMNCPHCSTPVADDDHRCQHCGRRLRGGAPVNCGATAPKLETVASAAHTGPVSSRRAIAYQPALFNLREAQKIVPIAPPKPQTNRDFRRQASAEPRGNRLPRRAFQQSLNFPVPRDEAVIERVLSQNARVASPVHRMIASVLDLNVILAGMALFAVVVHSMGGAFDLTRKTMPYAVILSALIWVLYKTLWCSLGLDTPGMHWVKLRTLNFDGHAPTFEQRCMRIAASSLSLLAAGLGLLWALADEEKLTWHDHISRTFVTIDETPGTAR